MLVKMLALGLGGERVTLVDEATGEMKWEVQSPKMALLPPYSESYVAMLPGGRFVASVGVSDEHWTLWDAASGKVHRAGARHGTGACMCVWPDVPNLGQRLVQAGCPVVAHTTGILAVAISSCGGRLATGGLDGTIILWDVWDAQTGKGEQLMKGDPWGVALSFSAHGARLAGGFWDGSIHIWDETGALLRTIFSPDESFVSCVNFSPTDERIILSAGDKIRMWNVDSGQLLRRFEGKMFAVFSPEGRTIATASTNNVRDIHLIDVESGTQLLRMVGHRTVVSSVTFLGDDGSKLASGSYDGTCKVGGGLFLMSEIPLYMPIITGIAIHNTFGTSPVPILGRPGTHLGRDLFPPEVGERVLYGQPTGPNPPHHLDVLVDRPSAIGG